MSGIRDPGIAYTYGALGLALAAAAALVLVALAQWPVRETAPVVILVLLMPPLTLCVWVLYRRHSRAATEILDLKAQARQALAESETLREVSREISGQVQLDALLDLVARRAKDLLEADYAIVGTIDEETGDRVWKSMLGVRSEALRGMRIPPGKGLAGTAIASGRLLVLEDFGSDPAFPKDDHPFHREEGMVAALALPLARADRVLGALVLGYRRSHHFNEREVAVATALASQAGIALENARLYGAEKRRAAELAAVIDRMSDGVVITDRRGMVVRCNESAVSLLGKVAVGDGLANALGRNVVRLETQGEVAMAPADWPMTRAARGEIVNGEELRICREPDSVRNVVVDAIPVVDGDGSVVLGLTVMKDVTALKEMENLKDEFLVLAAHELKTPLTSLKGYAQILMSCEVEGMEERHRRALGVINRQVDRVDRMVQQFLQVAEIRSGRLSLDPKPLGLSDLVSATCDRLRQAASGNDILFRQADPIDVFADAKSLELVLSNLVRNAIKYSPAGQPVEVSLAVEGAEAIVSVRDSGIGIPRDKQAHIFQRFYQVQPGTGSQGGIGLSLYASQELIASQGGRMWLVSEEGTGSVFYFSLPLWRPKP